MPTYKYNARTPFKPRGGNVIYSILDIEFADNIILYIFPGSISPNDIWIKYKLGGSRIRTPKHIHWAVDLLIKKFLNRVLTESLLKVFVESWINIHGLTSRDPESIIDRLIIARNTDYNQQFEALNSYGFFKADFLLHLMELLMLQEKTNKPDAYMFGKVLDGLLNSHDLYAIISTVTQTRH